MVGKSDFSLKIEDRPRAHPTSKGRGPAPHSDLGAGLCDPRPPVVHSAPPCAPAESPLGVWAAHPPMPTMYFISTRWGGGDRSGAADSWAPGWVGLRSELRPSFIEKTWRLYRPGQAGGRPGGGGPRPMGSVASRVGAQGPSTCSRQMEIAPRCLLPKLVTGQRGRGGRCHPRLPPFPSSPDRPPPPRSSSRGR